MNKEVYWIYVIAPVGVERPVKIGYARDIEARLATLQTGCWLRLRLHYRFSKPSKRKAFYAERHLHRKLEESGIERLAGEWFDMTAEEAKSFAMQYLERLKLIKEVRRTWTRDLEEILKGA